MGRHHDIARAIDGELDDFARLGRIGVDRIAIAGDQIAIRRKHQGQWTAKMIVLEDY
jgi:hypothetical protein